MGYRAYTHASWWGAGLYPLPTHGQTTTLGTDKLGVNIEMVSL